VLAAQGSIRIMQKLVLEALMPLDEEVGQVMVGRVLGSHKKVLGQVCFCAETVSYSDPANRQFLLVKSG